MLRHKIYSKLQAMYTQVNILNADFTETQINSFMNSLNKMDQIITDSMLHAERKQCKCPPTTMYSAVLDQANLPVQYWNV
jgi:hypothetical protein